LSSESAISNDQQVPGGVRVAYGIGSISDGVKNAGFDIFLGIYYVTVLGLPGTMSGLALFLALCVDAVTDPLVGSLSDNFKSKWGRRHPFMYFAAVPMGLCFYGLFSPPAGLDESQLFYWLLTFAIGTRLGLTFYMVPSSALGPEMTTHYDERTTLMSFRWAIGWMGGLVLQAVGWFFFFPDREQIAEGRLDLTNFPAFGAFAGIFVASAILISSLGTHSIIPRLHELAESVRFSVSGFIRELRVTFRSHSLRILLGTSVLSATALGTSEVLSVYMATWFWEFPSDGMGTLALLSAIPVLMGVFAARRVSVAIGDKRKTFIRLALFSILWGPLAVIFRLLDLAPDNGGLAIYFFVAGHGAFLAFVGVQIGIVSSSMIMDITDEVEYLTGERHEGVIMSVLSFAGKSTSGLGNFLGLSVLEWIAFPTGAAAAVGSVPPETITKLGLIVGPGLVVFHLAAVLLIRNLRLTRERYAEISKALDERRSS
jgi:Na+/melibiose symporter-like transporter